MSTSGAPPVVALVGPTASGKSAVALGAAARMDADIVAVDAFTVYRGMDVGTAKPSTADRERVPHHMIDVLEPWESCTVEWFQWAARAAVERVLSAGRRPLLVGGSGLYFRAVVDDLRFPPTDERVRSTVVDRVGGDAAVAHAELRARDPQAAARIDPGNLRRSVRALEVLDLTGHRFSEWRTAWEDHTPLYPGLQVIGLDVDRGTLDDRIARRARAMVTGGLVEEVRRLAAGPLSSTARAAIGYREALEHLARAPGERDPRDLVEAIRVRTRQYAVRQQRWFARDPRVRWTTAGAVDEELVRAWSS